MTTPTCRAEIESDGTLRLRLGGSWRRGNALPGAEEHLDSADPEPLRVVLDGTELEDWDSLLLVVLVRAIEAARERGLEIERRSFPDGVERLLQLAGEAPEGTRRPPAAARPLVERLGLRMLHALDEGRSMVTFLGEATLSFGRFLRGRARFRRSDFLVAIQESGAEALGIVSLISFLIGLILAFMGAVQLELFGAEIYVADLVAIGMAREMAPMMTGIVMAGRTGAAYAAQLGTMTVNEEVDSLRTLGISPMDFLVLPRMLALMVMMPLLTIYSNVLGIAGGFFVGTTLLGITPVLYWNQTVEAVGVDDFAIGIAKGSVIGALVAVAGCMRGMQCGRSASAVGLATTSAVVTAIVAIIVSEAVFSVVLQVLGL